VGTWGTGIFENDAALDWLDGVSSSSDLSVVEQTLDDVGESGPLDAWQCMSALAAAEVVAACAGRPDDGVPNEVDELVRRLGKPTSSLVAKARVAVIRIRRDSELRTVWKNSDHLGEWHTRMKDLEKRLLDRT
jgi:hypothetical protein